jgi:TolA-binding protein
VGNAIRYNSQSGVVGRSMHHPKHTVSLICALVCGLTACSPVAEVSYRHPDEVLFDRAMDAVQRNRFDVARLTLETLVNTYPESPYSSKAKMTLQDLRIENCVDSWTTLSECDSKPETIGPD